MTTTVAPEEALPAAAALRVSQDGGVPGGESLSRRFASDPGALQECYEELGPAVLAYLRRRVGAEDAEDVLQQVFLDLWRSRGSYDPQRRLEPWVFGIAHKRAVDHLRRRVRTEARESLPAFGLRVANEPEFVDELSAAQEMRSALAGLPPEQRETLVLAYFADLTQSQIADRLGVPLGTVKARAFRGLRGLAAALVPDEEER